MKTSYSITIAIALGLLAAPWAPAAQQVSPSSATDPSGAATAIIRMAPYRVSSDVPTPMHITEPRIPLQFVGRKVELKFTVDTSGRPYNISVLNVHLMTIGTGPDNDLAVQLTSAVQSWHFYPARDAQGNAFERDVILPVEIVEKDSPLPRTEPAAARTEPDQPRFSAR